MVKRYLLVTILFGLLVVKINFTFAQIDNGKFGYQLERLTTQTNFEKSLINPAMIAKWNNSQAIFSKNELYGINIKYYPKSFIFPISKKNNTFASITNFKISYLPLSDFDWIETYNHFVLSKKFKNLSLGISYNKKKIDVPSAGIGNGYNFDLGINFDIDKSLSLSVLFGGLLSKMKYNSGYKEVFDRINIFKINLSRKKYLLSYTKKISNTKIYDSEVYAGQLNINPNFALYFTENYSNSPYKKISYARGATFCYKKICLDAIKNIATFFIDADWNYSLRAIW